MNNFFTPPGSLVYKLQCLSFCVCVCLYSRLRSFRDVQVIQSFSRVGQKITNYIGGVFLQQFFLSKKILDFFGKIDFFYVFSLNYFYKNYVSPFKK